MNATMKYLTLSLLGLISITVLKAQPGFKIYHITSSHTSFPDTSRSKGHMYNKVLYEAKSHYMDSSVLIIIPPGLRTMKKINFVFWFHGWRNNIDNAVVRYNLANQFIDSKINAVLVLAETAKDAPDSYGGKLERANEFSKLLGDVMASLVKMKSIKKKTQAGQVILAGHSGAYRVISYILQNGNVSISEVILFDALYGETDKFITWIKSGTTHRFFNIYTDRGGTDIESKIMLKTLTLQNIHCDTLEEFQLTPRIIQQQRILVVHSLKEHDDIINNPDNFKLLLSNSMLKK